MVESTRKHYGTKLGKEETLQYFQDAADEMVREIREKFMTPNGEKIRMPDGKFKTIPVRFRAMMFIGRDTVRICIHFSDAETAGYATVKKFKSWMKKNMDYESIESDYNPFMVHIYLMGPTPRSIYW